MKQIIKTIKPPYTSQDIAAVGIFVTFISVVVLLGLLFGINQFSFLIRAQQSVEKNVPKTGEEQFIVKIKKGAFIGKKTSDDITVRNIIGKYAKVKKSKKEFESTQKLISKKDSSKSAKLENIYSIQVEPTDSLPTVFERLKSDPLVESVQWNYIYEPDAIPNDPNYSQQWAHSKTQAPQAWDLTTGNSNVVIALIGTGVKWDHEDLAANIWTNSKEIAANNIDDDANGFIDDVRGWNFESNNGNPMDVNGHETSVAGVAAAASNNAKGIAGVCWKCKIMPLRVSYTSVQVTNALYYAINNGVKIVNMSFGSYDPLKYGPDTMVENAVNFGTSQGVLMVATAGNESVNTKRFPGALENVIGVAATDSTDARAGFSNYGDWVDVAAPGSGIYSTTLTGYGGVNGTSFSAPYVSGIAGLIFSRNPTLSFSDARLIIEYTVDKITADRFIGSGRMNTNRSVSSNSRPSLFAVIKSPNNNGMLPDTGSQEIWGTVLGDSYVLEYKDVNSSTWTQLSTGTETVNGLLGRLDTAILSSTMYNLRLKSFKGSASDIHEIRLYAGQGFQSGFPKDLGGGAIVSPAAIADIDGNGDLEIVIGSNSGKVFVLNHDGSYYPGWPKSAPSPYVFGAPAVGDIDGDGKVEIVVATYGGFTTGGHVTAWRYDGTQVSGWPKAVGQVRGAVALENLDSDPALEILVASGGGNFKGMAYAFKGNGSNVSGWPYTLPDVNIQTAPGIIRDIESLIVFSDGTKNIILKKDGSIFKQWSKSSIQNHPIVLDIDRNSQPDIAQSEGDQFVIRSLTGQIIWQQSAYGGSYPQSAAGDLNGDGKPEIVFATQQASSKVYLWGSTGVPLSGWPKSVSEELGEPSIGDVDGDGNPDVVVSSKQGLIYAWDKSGNLLSKFPKATGSPLNRSATIADLDKDGDVELIAGAENGTLYVWDLPGKYNADKQPWPMSRHDIQNTGSMPVAKDGESPVISITNPSNGVNVNGKVTIEAQATDNIGVIKVEFYVDNALLSSDSESPYSASWDTSSLTNGSSHTLFAKAYDSAGNIGTSQSITVTVKQPEIDTDNDGFSDSLEAYLGTDSNKACPATSTANDEPIDAWPPDFNDDQTVDISDVNALRPPVFNSVVGAPNYSPRYDLNNDGIIDISDVNALRPPVFGSHCSTGT